MIDQGIQATVNAIVFPQGALCPVIASMRTQFSDDGALRGFFHRKRDEDTPALVPFPDDILLPVVRLLVESAHT